MNLMKKTILSILLTIMCVCVSKAVIVQTVQLKNGSVIKGYILQQKGNDITFRSEEAEICIDGKSADNPRDTRYGINQLDPKWKKWAEEHDAFEGTGDNRTLTLSDISFRYVPSNDSVAIASVTETFQNEFPTRHPQISKVRLLERGVHIKYLELTPNVYNFSWDDVESITADRRPKTALSGIDRVYYLKNGREIKGQYAGETYNTLSLYTDGGVVETIDIDDVTKYLYKGINPNQNIFQQSELIDVVRTKDRGTYRGVITERNFTDGNMYLMIQLSGGGSQMLKFKDIEGYSKEENNLYEPKSDVLLSNGEILINRMLADSVKVKKIGDKLYLDSINTRLTIPVRTNQNTEVVVEYYNPHHKSSDNLILVKVDKDLHKKKARYFFSPDIYEMKKFIPEKTETSVNNTTRIEYQIPGRGVFAIYDLQTREAMPFIIK